MNSLQVKRTDFYTIIPLDSHVFLILIEDVVAKQIQADSLEQAEEYVLYHYYELMTQDDPSC